MNDKKYFANDWIYDEEVYGNFYCVTLLTSDGKKGDIFEISDRKDNREQLKEYCRDIYRKKGRMVGFNNLGYDYPVLHFILTNPNCTPKEIFAFSDKLIKSMKDSRFGSVVPTKDRLLYQVDLFKVNHFDNAAKATSLKILEFNMRMSSIEDLPFPVGSKLTYDQMDKVIQYNIHDVKATLKFYHENYDALVLRKKLGEKYGIDFTNMNDSKIGGEIFIKAIEDAAPNSCYSYNKQGKRKINQTPRSSIALKDVILPYVKFERPEFQAVLDWLRKQVITETKGVFSDILESDLGDVAKYAEMKEKKVLLKNVLNPDSKGKARNLFDLNNPEHVVELEKQKDLILNDYPFTTFVETIKNLKKGVVAVHGYYRVAEVLNVIINGHKYVFGTGGLHSSVNPSRISEDETFIIIDLDVASFYPFLAIANSVFPEHLGITFCHTYLSIYEERKSYPKSAPENLALKLALNGTYGLIY